MMLPNQYAMATTRPGGSVHQGMVRPQQSDAFMGALGPPSVAQGVNGLTDAARKAIQAARTEQHAMVQTEQNFGPRVPEHAARNMQARAKKLSERHRMALFATGLVPYTSLTELGRLLSQG